MSEAYIVSAVRTASGRRGGSLALWHPARLAARVLDEAVHRAGADPAAIEDVIMGCVTTASEQSANVARNAVLMSNLPRSVPGVTIDRQCGSSQQALQFAAQAVMSGMQDLVVAAGVESMTRVPIGSSASFFTDQGIGQGPYPPELLARLGADRLSQFDGAEMMASKYGLTRDELDRYALETHRRASQAEQSGAFDAEILPLPVDPDDAGSPRRTDPPRCLAGIDRLGPATARRRPADRRDVEPDHRRRLGRARRIGRGGEAPWSDPACARPQGRRHRRRSGHHAGRAHSGDGQGARESRPRHRRH